MGINDQAATAGMVLGVDHVGFVVPDLDAAVAFFVDALGFEDIERRGTLGDDAGDQMTTRLGVHPRAVARYAFVQRGTARVELLQWTAPDRHADPPRNSDAGGRHLALAVDDVGVLVDRLAAIDGVEVREANERGFVYVRTPFGLEVQLIPA